MSPAAVREACGTPPDSAIRRRDGRMEHVQSESEQSGAGTAGRVPISAQELGAGNERVVFLHGLMGRGKNFTTAARGLGDDYRCLLVDLPNHGESAWTDRFDYAEQADLVADFLASGFAAQGPVNLVGHSMGGKTAMTLALRHPELVERLVVVDIAPARRPRPAKGSSSDFTHLLGSLAALDLGAIETRADADRRLQEAIPSRTVRGFLLQNLRRVDGGFRWQPNLAMLLANLDAIGDFPRTEAHFDGPVLWIAGERSDYIGEDDLPEMKRLFPRTTRVAVKDSGHWVHSEQPGTFLDILRYFLRQPAGGAGR